MLVLYENIWLLCKRDLEKHHFTKGKCYKGKREDTDMWKVKNDKNEIILLSYTYGVLEYFHHTFYETNFKSVCNSYPDLIDPIPYEYTLTFKYFFDNCPKLIKTDEKTVDAIDDEQAKNKIRTLWPNVHDIKILGRY